MSKDEIIREIEGLKDSINNLSFPEIEAKIEELKQDNTINPIKRHKLKKEIKELEKRIEIEREAFKERKLKQIKTLQRKLKTLEKKEYFNSHKKSIIAVVASVLVGISAVSGLFIYNSDVRKLEFVSEEICVNAGEFVDLSYLVKPNKLDGSKLEKIELVYDTNYLNIKDGKYETFIDGETTAHLIYNGKEFDSISIKIEPVLVESIKLNDFELGLSRDAVIEPIFSPANVTHKDIKIISDNNSVISTEGNKIKALDLGEANITIISADGPKCTAKITVVPVPVEQIKIEGSVKILRLSESEYKAKISPADATDKSIVWSVSDGNFASISEDGILKALKAGTVDVIARNEISEIVNTFTVTIDPIVMKSFEVAEQELRIVEGNSKQIRCINIQPETADDKSFVYDSSDHSIATVSEGGVVKGISPGKTKVHVTSKDGGYKTDVTVIIDERIEYTSRGNVKSGINVYVSNNGVYHRKSNCSGMKYYTTMDLNDAIGIYTVCAKCRNY